MTGGVWQVGFQRGRGQDRTRLDWAGQGPRPLAWSLWYPSGDLPAPARAARPKFFVEPERISRATPLAREGGWPLIVLSHGTGGTAEGLDWFACRMVAAGYIVLGVDHHGNCASEPYRPEGFLAWWERTLDLSALLDLHLDRGILAGLVDQDRIFAAGFSMGGHTVIAALGAMLDLGRYGAWAKAHGDPAPREFPDLADHLPRLLAQSPSFQAAWERQGDYFGDGRVKAALAMAPPPTVQAFTPESLAALTRPLAMVVGGADREAPVEHGALWLAERLPQAELLALAPEVAHFVFLNECTELGRQNVPLYCVDDESVSRAAIHDQVAALALSRFR